MNEIPGEVTMGLHQPGKDGQRDFGVVELN
jgi:hypothetical protein